MRVFTNTISVKSLTEKYTKVRDKLDQSYVKGLGSILKRNSEAVKGIEAVEAQCAKEKSELTAESAEARKILEDIANG